MKLGSIGDIIHTLPAVAAIRAAWPDAELSWVVERRSAEILGGNSTLDRLIEIDTHDLRGRGMASVMVDAVGQVRDLREFKFDAAIDFQGLWKSAAIAKLAGIPKRWGFSQIGLREPSSGILLTDTVEVPDKTHVIRKNIALAAAASGIADVPIVLDFPITTSPAHLEEADEIQALLDGSEFAVLNPAGGWVTKLWSAEKFGDLADRLWTELGIASVVAVGPNEGELAERVASSSRAARLTVVQPSLKGFYELAKRCRVYVGGDTGPTHIAVAAGAKVVGLFGPTEWWRNGSLNPDDVVVERLDIDCRIDCHRRTCSKWICMETDADKVFAAVKKRLGLDPYRQL